MKIGLVTDNTCNLTREEIQKYDVRIVSLYINRGGVYSKSVNLDLEKYYEELAAATELPSTSQPSPQDFIEVFEEALKTYDVLIVPVLSGKLSGTSVSATIAARDFEQPIHVVDSQLIADGTGLLVKNLGDMINQGVSIDKLVEYASNFQKKTRTFCSTDDLSYLQKGGRIGKAKALMGNLLKMKPIIRVDDGELKPVENVRGNKKLLESLVSHVFNEIPPENLRRVRVLTIWRKEDAATTEKMFREKAPEAEIETRIIEPVIGTHLGPQGIGIVSEMK
ncbi:MAG: DegV family protein [Kosmotogaceae bacterium]|nr:DegV family protein [Kosmotogaceae bacterium]